MVTDADRLHQRGGGCQGACAREEEGWCEEGWHRLEENEWSVSQSAGVRVSLSVSHSVSQQVQEKAMKLAKQQSSLALGKVD